MIPGEQWQDAHNAYFRYMARTRLEILVWIAVIVLLHKVDHFILSWMLGFRVIWIGRVNWRLMRRAAESLKRRDRYIADANARQSHTGIAHTNGRHI